MTTIAKKHTILLKILNWFHDACTKANLRYYIVGGTMLGAVRHKGFIPWDDDIDVAMPRSDYNKFIELFGSVADSKYIVESPRADNLDYTYLCAKIYDTSTTLIERKRNPVKRGIYIDLFPLDGIGSNIEEANKNYREIANRINLYNTIVCDFRKGRSWYKNASILLGRFISPAFITERHLNSVINEKCSKRDFDEFSFVGNLVGNWGCKEIVPHSYFGTPQRYSFEGMTVYGVEKPHEYLTSLYGN